MTAFAAGRRLVMCLLVVAAFEHDMSIIRSTCAGLGSSVP
jgi:hypothetical protein